MIVIFYYYPSAAGEQLMLELPDRTLCGMNERGERRAKEEKKAKKGTTNESRTGRSNL